MDTRKLSGSLACLLLASSMATGACHGNDARSMPFRIAGGTILQLPATDGGPLPAENDDVKIEGAGVAIVSANGPSQRAALLWGFDFTAKSSQSIERVVVEEVAPSDPARLLVDDAKPILKGKAWSATTSAIEATATTAPWLFDDKSSIFVFRFTITVAGKPPMVLYQPAWFSQPSKATLRQLIDRFNTKAAAPVDDASQGQRTPR